MLPDSLDMSVMKRFINSYGAFFFCYCQALGECSRYDEAHEIGIHSYAISILTERPKNASVLKQYLHDDFALNLEY